MDSRNSAGSLTEGEGIELPARETAARRKDQGANYDDDPTGREPDARQADNTNAPSRAYRCLAAHDADFIEASGQMCRTERPDIWAHCLPEGKVASRALARRGRSTYGITRRRRRTGGRFRGAGKTAQRGNDDHPHLTGGYHHLGRRACANRPACHRGRFVRHGAGREYWPARHVLQSLPACRGASSTHPSWCWLRQSGRAGM